MLLCSVDSVFNDFISIISKKHNADLKNAHHSDVLFKTQPNEVSEVGQD